MSSKFLTTDWERGKIWSSLFHFHYLLKFYVFLESIPSLKSLFIPTLHWNNNQVVHCEITLNEVKLVYLYNTTVIYSWSFCIFFLFAYIRSFTRYTFAEKVYPLLNFFNFCCELQLLIRFLDCQLVLILLIGKLCVLL